MAEKLSENQTVILEKLAISNAFQMEAIINVLVKKSILTKDEIIEEIARLHGNG
jgi:hypothetical protein